jgi:catechol 2,3-dioxygenase-like lactoylglutathione lyase family enzyme
MIQSCIPVIPSVDLETSLRFWRDGLGFKLEDTMHRNGELIWCMLSSSVGRVMLNVRAGTPECPANYEGVRLYWAPRDLEAQHAKLAQLGFAPSEITTRGYGQTEFFLNDPDGFSHCFGVPSRKAA